MNRFARFSLAITTVALALSGCTSSPAPQTVSSRVYASDTISICGEPGHQKDGSNYEVTVEGVCALVNKYYDPTTERNRAVYKYVISPERSALLHAAYTPFAIKLRDKVLNEGIPHRLRGDMYYLTKGRLVRDATGNVAYEPAPQNGWATLESIYLEKGQINYGYNPYISMQVYMRDGKIDMSVEPAQFTYRLETMRELRMRAPFSVSHPDEQLVYGTTESFTYYNSLGDTQYDVTLIDYIKLKRDYWEPLKPSDSHLTVLSRPYRAGWFQERSDMPTVSSIKLTDKQFIELLAKVEVNGSDWNE